MKKVIYVGMPFDGGKSGISRYIEKTIEGLSSEVEINLIMMRKDYALIHERLSGSYNWLSLGKSDLWQKPLFNILFHLLVLPVYCFFRDVDYVFFPAGNRRFPLFFPKKTITTVHDFSHLHIPGKYDFFRHQYVTKVLPRFLKNADLIFTPSESTKKDLLDLCGIDEKKVRVNLLGFNYPKLNVISHQQREKNFLYVSRIEHPGKNHLGLIKAFEIFCENFNSHSKLYLVGGDWNGSEAVHEYHKSSKFKDQIKFLGHLTEEELEKEYRSASVFIYPSFFEGFGLPLLEAMARGLPIISSDRGSLPEVGGNSVHYIDPEDHQMMADTMHLLIESVSEQQKYIQLGFENLKRFSWETHTQQFPR